MMSRFPQSLWLGEWAGLLRSAKYFVARLGELTGMNLSEIDLPNFWLIAQVTQEKVPEAGAEGLFPTFPVPVLIALMFAMFYFIVLRPQQSKDKNFRTMLESLKEKDRVVTIGGIHGVVTNVQRERDEVTIRIDESTGTKIHVGTSAIAKLVTDDDKDEKKSK